MKMRFKLFVRSEEEAGSRLFGEAEGMTLRCDAPGWDEIEFEAGSFDWVEALLREGMRLSVVKSEGGYAAWMTRAEELASSVS